MRTMQSMKRMYHSNTFLVPVHDMDMMIDDYLMGYEMHFEMGLGTTTIRRTSQIQD